MRFCSASQRKVFSVVRSKKLLDLLLEEFPISAPDGLLTFYQNRVHTEVQHISMYVIFHKAGIFEVQSTYYVD